MELSCSRKFNRDYLTKNLIALNKWKRRQLYCRLFLLFSCSELFLVPSGSLAEDPDAPLNAQTLTSSVIEPHPNKLSRSTYDVRRFNTITRRLTSNFKQTTKKGGNILSPFLITVPSGSLAE